MKAILPVLAFAAGCGSITTQYGARVLEPGDREQHVTLTTARWTDPLLGPTTVPRVDLAWRFGLTPDADLGLKLLGGAPAVDVRWRMVRSERWDVAVAPGIVGAYLPVAAFGNTDFGGLQGVGFFEVATPVLAEWQATPRSSWAAAARPGLRVLATNGDPSGWYISEDSVRVDVLTAGGLRYERRGGRFGWGLSFDLVARPARSAPIGWSIGFDWIALRHRHVQHLDRDLRRSARGAPPVAP